MKTKVLPVRIDKELYDEAKEYGINISSVVRVALMNEIIKVKLGESSCVSKLTKTKNKDGQEIITIHLKK